MKKNIILGISTVITSAVALGFLAPEVADVLLNALTNW